MSNPFEIPPEPTEGSIQEPSREDDQKPERSTKSTATVLVEIAQQLYEFGISTSEETYAVPRSGASVVRMLRGGKTSLRAQLARKYFALHGKAASQAALADALQVVEGHADAADPIDLFIRVAAQDGTLWLDLGDGTGRAVAITTDGWSVRDHPGVLFKRTALTAELPEPERGGELIELWDWLNVAEVDRPLVLAWLVHALFHRAPHTVLGIFGEQGTGKTTAEKILVSLIDPSPVPVRKPPRDADSWVTAASGSWVVGLDNLSDIPGWLSDSIARAVTGEGDVRRKLYTDGDTAVFAFRRCVIVNGIDLGALRPDLSERMVPIDLEQIDEHSRRDEDELWPAWHHAQPRVLGALLDLAAGVKAALPFVDLVSKPRMADYARTLAAVDKVLGTDGFNRYNRRAVDLAADGLAGNPFAVALRDTVTDSFTGTSADLLERLTPDDEKWRPPKGWPTDARQATVQLRRIAPSLRKTGWTVTDEHDTHTKVIRWTITAPPQHENPGNHTRARPQDPQTAGAAGAAGESGGEYCQSHVEHPRLSSDEQQCCQGGAVAPKCKLCGQSATYWRESA